jgi:hypothetical protein
MTAMRKSNAVVPKELEEICAEAGGQRKWGFGGHGFKFDKNETLKFKEARKVESEVKEEPEVETEISKDERIKQAKDGKWWSEFTINDFPAMARSEVTKKQNLAMIMEATGVTIIQRGVFVVPGTKIPVGERKLHLLVEGDTMYAVQVALEHIEKLIQGLSIASKKDTQQKYKVV